MAYKIRHLGTAHQEAIFTHLIVQLAPEKVRKLNKELDLHRQIMRHLIVQKEAGEAVEKKESETKEDIKEAESKK